MTSSNNSGMSSRRSYLPWIILAGLSAALIISAADQWHEATDPKNAIDLIIENDRKHFRSLQPIWDQMEETHPDWVRPQPTTEAEYQRWQEYHQKVNRFDQHE